MTPLVIKDEDSLAWKRHEALYQSSFACVDGYDYELSGPTFARRVSESIAAAAIFPSEEIAVKRVPQVVLFTYLCAPRKASARGLIAAAEYVSIVWLFNDVWSLTGEIFLIPAHSEYGNHRLEFIRSWLRGIEREFGDRSARFIESFYRYHQSLILEHVLTQKPGHPTFEEYVDKRRGRYEWVATSPYFDLWELVEGLEPPEDQRPTAEALKELGVELIYLANDIGSIQRDSGRGNYVRLLAGRLGLHDVDAALDKTARVYRDKATEFLALWRTLAPDSRNAAYADMLAHIIDGNLRSTAFLASPAAFGRYSPTVRTCLDGMLASSLLTAR